MKKKCFIKEKLIYGPVIRNIFGIGLFRITGVLTNFLLIGLIYRYISNEEINGVWLTVFSLLTWIAFFDFGMGNSLRNKLTECIAKNDIKQSNMYISTTYIIMSIPTVFIVILACTTAYFIDWIGFFDIKGNTINNEYLTLFICIVFILYSINFYLSLIFAILHATFNSYMISGIQSFVNIVNIIFIFILYLMNFNDLILLGVIYIGTSVIVLIFVTFWIFKKNKQNLSFKFKFFNKSIIKDIVNVGLKFLILQLAIIVLFNTDNILISKFIGVKEVTSYQLINKLLGINTILLGIVLTPIWTKVLKDATETNLKENKKTISKLLIIFSFLVLGVIVLGYLAPFIIRYWIGSDIIIKKELIIFIMIFTVCHMWSNIFQTILNGLNKLNIQIICYGIATLINIPLSIYFVLQTELGVAAIILGTICSLVVPSIILPFYTLRLFNRM